MLVGIEWRHRLAVVAAIAVDALGPENVLGVSMPGPYSSEGSKTDAAAVAGLSIDLLTIPISEVFDSYLKAMAPAFGTLAPDVTKKTSRRASAEII